jgi:hypothetical protein
VAAELALYLVNSFGNRTNIDYGMGHEMTFVMFVCGLFKVSFLGPEDMVAMQIADPEMGSRSFLHILTYRDTFRHGTEWNWLAVWACGT